MTTVKIKFRASSVDMREGTLYYQILHNRTPRQINTGYKLFPSEWDADKSVTILGDDIDQSRRLYLLTLKEDIRFGMARLDSIIARMEKSGRQYTADDIVAEYAKKISDGGFVAFIRKHIIHLQKSNKLSSARKTKNAMNSFTRFIGDDDIAFERLDCDCIEEYEGWLKVNGVCPNTSSFYMRKLRSVYNIAVDRGLTEQRNPFKNVFTGITKTVKRAISLNDLRKIKNLDLTDKPSLDNTRNLFILSFYLRGIPFVDMFFLKKNDLVNGVLSYRRQKTGQLLQIKWEKPMQHIIDRLGETATTYLLPIIKDTDTDAWKQYENERRKANRNLKKIGKLVGLELSLTTYVARHTWASVAKHMNIPITVISEGLGHDSVNTTKIYLASLDTSVVDKANSKIMKAL